MSETYSPQSGSLPDRVLAFLEANPDEELSRKDIAVKFDVAATPSIDSVLQLAVARGCLVRGRNSKVELVWSLGEMRALRERAQVTGTDDRDPLPVRQIVTSLRPQPVAVDPLAIKVRKGVRLQTPAEKQVESFDRLFNTFEVGDSAEFEASWHETLAAQVRRYQRSHKGVRFVFADTEPGKVGMERRK